MKRKFFSFSLVLLVGAIWCNYAFASSDEYIFEVPEKYTGTYIPATFYDYFESTLDFENAKNSPVKGFHDVLFMYDNCCRSDAKFHDSYSITAGEFKDYKFIENKDDVYLLDNNGFLYKRFSKDIAYKVYDDYVFDKVFNCIKDREDVSVSATDPDAGGDKYISINGKSFFIMFDTIFCNDEDVNIWLRCKEDWGWYGIKLHGISATIYKAESTDSSVDITDEVFMEFPVFSYEPMTAFEDLSKEELRVYRNLQFARHGYKFKSNDLSEIFGAFSWYEPVHSNVDNLMTNEEKKIVNQAVIYEQR